MFVVIDKEKLNETVIRNLLSLSISPTPGKLEAVCERYRTEPNLTLLGCELDDELVGCIGIRFLPRQQAVIEHISVLPERRGKGIGSRMIQFACEEYSLQKVEAETDREAVDFYRSIGFEIKSLGEKYPGVERYTCLLENQERKSP